MSTSINPGLQSENPKKIDHYHIIKKLGQGGMSIVYQAIDERLKRPVALKLLHPMLAEGHEYRSRFFREAEAVARLTHPNIVQIFDVSSSGHQSEHLYLVTELIAGSTLREFAKNFNMTELPELSAMIIWCLTQALEHAHQKGIIHRDIKPENIMINNDGHIKLMDFGIATIGSEESMTQAGVLLGSFAHVAPEVIKGQKASHASDIYSLSTVFYWLLTGELPFEAESPHALLKAIVDSEAKKVQKLSPYVSDDLAQVLQTGMEKNPKNRFKTAQEMGLAIEQALFNMGIPLDQKLLTGVLQNHQINVPKFKLFIQEHIKNKIEYLKSHDQEAQAFALACRLETNVQNVSTKGPKFWPKATVIIFMLIPLGFGIYFYNYAQPKTKHQQNLLEINASTPESLDSAPAHHMDKNDQAPSFNEPSHAPQKEILKEAGQEVHMTIWPFANVIIDGVKRAEEKKSLQLWLNQGTHRILFTHPYAATIEKIITVLESGPLIEISVSLQKSKPAMLVIMSNVDADIAVDGNYKGTTHRSITEPVVIPMPDKTHALDKEITISKEGFIPYEVNTELIAGQIKEIKVILKPEMGE